MNEAGPLFDSGRLRSAPLVAGVEVHGEIDSTNRRAADLAASAAELPLLVVAERQTAGRGRAGKSWWASRGALTFSLLIDPASLGMNRATTPALSIAVALAACDAAAEAGVGAAMIKWPNDVLVGGRKLAGVLLEAPRPDRLVIGVGMNVANRVGDAPPDVAATATSLADEGVDGAAAEDVLVAILRSLARRAAQLASNDPAIAAAWNARSALTGEQVALRVGNERVTGVCDGVAADGSLLLRAHDGVHAFRTGTVEGWGRAAEPS